MKKTVNINLNSFMFNIDEDAYIMLNIYLSKLQEHFAKLEEGSEIVRDIEARLAEIFGMKINESKQVINLSDVEEVILILGNVQDITGENISEESNDAKKETEPKKRKKLYRDPDNKIIGGVCSGLSEYTGISITTWRIIFLIFLFVGQVSIIAYFILWIAVPEAKTTAQKLEMKGDKINLSNIEKTVKQEYEDLKKNFKNINSKKTSDIFTNIGNAIMSVLTITAKVFGKLLGFAFLIFGAFTIAALTIGLLSVGQDNLFFSNHFINMIWLPGLLEYVTNSGTAWLLSISMFIVFLIPVIVMIYWGVLLLFKVKGNKYLSIGTFAVWVLAIIITVLSSLNIGASFRSIDQKVTKEIIFSDTTKTYYFDLSPEFSDIDINPEVKIEGINELQIFINQHLIIPESNKLRSYPDVEFYTTKEDSAEMQLIYYARGANKAEAKENLKTVEYNYTINDSVTILDPYFYITSEKFRAQSLKIKVFIPENSKLVVDKSLLNIIDIEDIIGENEGEELTDKKLMSTRNGFVVL
jgi:phage shock protein PspC (stress-responsive transcriptional regulator)